MSVPMRWRGTELQERALPAFVIAIGVRGVWPLPSFVCGLVGCFVLLHKVCFVGHLRLCGCLRLFQLQCNLVVSGLRLVLPTWKSSFLVATGCCLRCGVCCPFGHPSTPNGLLCEPDSSGFVRFYLLLVLILLSAGLDIVSFCYELTGQGCSCKWLTSLYSAFRLYFWRGYTAHHAKVLYF